MAPKKKTQAKKEEVSFENEGYRYVVLEQAGLPRAAVVEAPMKRIDPLWVPYVRVEDAGRTAALARRLGGRVLLQNDDAAIILDPRGAAFGVQRWSPRRADEEARR